MTDSRITGPVAKIKTDWRMRPEHHSVTGRIPPDLAILSNGRYSVAITGAGGGHSNWLGLDVTRWREDATRNCWGQFCYIRDLNDGTTWSAVHQPVCRTDDEHELVFQADKVEFRRRDGDTETHLDVCVSPNSDARCASSLFGTTAVSRAKWN